MARTLPTGFSNELNASVMRYAFFFEAIFPSTTLYLSTLSRDLTVGGNVYLGNGWINAVSPDTEDSNLKATGLVVVLSGVPSALVSTVLNGANAASYCNLYLGVLDADYALAADEYLAFSGDLDTIKIKESGAGSTIELNYESELITKRKRREYRYTDQDQQNEFAGDLGLQYVVQAHKYTGYWGSGKNPLNIQRRDRR